MADFLFSGGVIIDGSGSPPFQADILTHGDRIARIDPALGSDAAYGATRIDCAGLTLTPGFIDSHTHSDLQVVEGRTEKLRQGVTTEVIGNCGFSAYPPARDPNELRSFANGIFCGDDAWGWPSTEAYLRAIETAAPPMSLPLVGHGSLRIAVAGSRQGPPHRIRVALHGKPARRSALRRSRWLLHWTHVRARLQCAHGRIATPLQCNGKARRHLYQPHPLLFFRTCRRGGRATRISPAAAEAVFRSPIFRPSARTTGICKPKRLTPSSKRRAEGVDVEFDCYPYVAGSSVLTQVLPQSALDGGLPALMARLRNPAQRQAIREETLRFVPWRWSDIHISSVGTERNLGCDWQEPLKRLPPSAAATR